jgi:hypothetical protein
VVVHVNEVELGVLLSCAFRNERNCSFMYVILDRGQFTFVAKCLRRAPYAYGCILLRLLVVCLYSSCDGHHGCVLSVVQGVVQFSVLFLAHMHTHNLTKKKIIKKFFFLHPSLNGCRNETVRYTLDVGDELLWERISE